MNEQEINERVEMVFSEKAPAGGTQEALERPERPDMYEESRRARKREEGPRTHGSRPITHVYINDALNRLQVRYKRAEDEVEHYEEIGANRRAELVRETYMSEDFGPAVDAMVRLTSKEDLLNSPEVLKALDKMTLLKGTRGDGYTKTLLEQLYLDSVIPEPTISDVEVTSAIRHIRQLIAEDQMRVAVGYAGRIKNKIDQGQNIATPEDYELIQRVVLEG